MKLTEYEQREWAAIEELLLRDPDLSACYEKERRAVGRTGPLARCLIVPGILIMTAAAFLGFADAFGQGLGLVVLGLAWWTATTPGVRGRARRSIERCIKTYEASWFPPPYR